MQGKYRTSCNTSLALLFCVRALGASLWELDSLSTLAASTNLSRAEETGSHWHKCLHAGPPLGWIPTTPTPATLDKTGDQVGRSTTMDYTLSDVFLDSGQKHRLSRGWSPSESFIRDVWAHEKVWTACVISFRVKKHTLKKGCSRQALRNMRGGKKWIFKINFRKNKLISNGSFSWKSPLDTGSRRIYWINASD